MFEKLKNVEDRYEEISDRLIDPAVIGDNEQYKNLMKEYKNLTPIVEKYREYAGVKKTLDEAKGLLDEGGMEKDFREMVEEEYSESKEKIEQISEELKILLLPKDPNDEKNVIVEIRGGAGGDEAALFANSLYRMYTMYGESRRWKSEVLSANPTELGGFKEISFSIEGEGAYSRLKFESGVHRVQRVPETETQGRIHTSTVTVAVLPEMEDVEVEINPDDLQIDAFRAGGAGGQHVNKTSSAIRITHLPTGLVVECQDERSQFKNKDKAMKILRSRLYEKAQSEQNEKIASERKLQVGTGDRSERIRTYNYPQGRVTDHRIGLTLYKIESILNGDLDELLDALITFDQAEKLQAQSEE
ncbi:peptide chain release factor 1 [Zongyangia hominis]|uniref:Peptide chain release factor 1 n=1 Tax=Zongyangia hominis TaxID=2763677 RepID=A0A926IBJ7_9FIRM|nr:peptide chain release factor 1 [Zongyangia hominis]MBC8570165.1 peptide chain release factor 1 [Zongyangia hominis]